MEFCGLDRKALNRTVPTVFAVASLFVAGACSSLAPLPSVDASACSRDAGGVAELWTCLKSLPVPASKESGFASTVRVVTGDLSRKAQDQEPGRACSGEVPSGFEVLSGLETEPGRAPLHALYHAPAADKPIVIIVHGLYDSKFSRYVRITAQGLSRSGFGVLAPDMRWHGCLLSSESLPSLGVEESRDLLAWARWLHKRHPDHPVGLLGFSLGGLDVIHAAGQPSAGEDLKAGVIALCPPIALERTARSIDADPYFSDFGWTSGIRSKFHAYLRARLKALDIPIEPKFGAFLAWLAPQLYPATPDPVASLLRAADPIPSIRSTQTPLLVLEASNDPIIPDSSRYALAEAARGRSRVLDIETPYGGHIGQLGLYPEWLSEIFNSFFEAVPRLRK